MGVKRLAGKRLGGKRHGGETTRGGNGSGVKRPGFQTFLGCIYYLRKLKHSVRTLKVECIQQ